MEEQLISFETAVLAKEKGFKIPTPVMYKGNERSYGHNNEWGIDEQRLDGKFPYRNQQWYSIPTQSGLQKWLREKYSIYAESRYNETFNYFEDYVFCPNNYPKPTCIQKDVHSEYEIGLEFALIEALKLIQT